MSCRCISEQGSVSLEEFSEASTLFGLHEDEMVQRHCHDMIAWRVRKKPSDSSIAEFERPPAKYSATSTQPHQPHHQARNCVGRCPTDFAQANEKHAIVVSAVCQAYVSQADTPMEDGFSFLLVSCEPFRSVGVGSRQPKQYRRCIMRNRNHEDLNELSFS